VTGSAARRTRTQRKPRRVALLGRAQRKIVGERLAKLEIALERKGIDVVLVRGDDGTPGAGFAPDPEMLEAARRADLLITLGGDGTILAGARVVAGTKVPILPVNLGGLGFLASFEGRELDEAVRAALEGSLTVEKRALLEARLLPHGGARPRPLGHALNDVVVKHSTTFRALRMEAWAGDSYLGPIVADGLVISTPSGSTAYSLSAGGPVVAPGLDALVVTPICPHTLGMRSLVLPPHLDVRVRVTGRDATDALVSLDGLEAIPVGPRDAVRVRLVPDAVRFLRRPGVTLPVTVPQKLGWVGSKHRRS
jgi:NAD+ kinase